MPLKNKPHLLTLLAFLLLADFVSAKNQTKINSYCGSNSVYALLRLNDINLAVEDITELPVVKKKNKELSILDLKIILKKYDLDYECVKIDADQLKLLKNPFIAHFYSKKIGNHFSTCWSTVDGVDIIDYPRSGFVRWDSFKVHYTGHALIDSKYVLDRVVNKQKSDKSLPTLPDRRVVNKQKPDKSLLTLPNGKAKGPRFHWKTNNNLKVGTIGKDEIAEEFYRFDFTNVGNKVLQISDLKPSCTCLAASIEKETLKPGESSSLSIKIDKNNSGPFSEYCYFKTNDPDMKIGKVTIEGNIFTPIQVSAIPNKCDFGKIVPKRLYSEKIIIQNIVRDGQNIANIKSISNTLACLKTELGNQWNQKNYGEVKLREIPLNIDLVADMSPGYYTDSVVLAYEDRLLTIPITFKVKLLVEADPSVCVFHLPSDNKYKKISLRTYRDSGFTIEHIRTNALWIKIHPKDAMSSLSNYHELILEIIDQEDDFLKDTLELSGKIDTQDWSIDIPILCIKK